MPNVNMGHVKVTWRIPGKRDVSSVISAQYAIRLMDPLINNLAAGEMLTIQPSEPEPCIHPYPYTEL